MTNPERAWPPTAYPTREEQAFRPTLRDRTYHALRQTIDGKKDTLRNIALQTGLEWGWVRMFALDKPPNPGVNQIETLYAYLTGERL